MLLPTTKTWAETRSNEKYIRSCLQCCIVVKHWVVWTNTLFIWQYYLLWKFYFVEYFEVFQTEIKVSIFKYLHLNYLLNIWEFQNIKLCSLGLFSPVHCLHWIDGCKKKFPRISFTNLMRSSVYSDFVNPSKSQFYLMIFLPTSLCCIYYHVIHAFINNMHLHEKMA